MQQQKNLTEEQAKAALEPLYKTLTSVQEWVRFMDTKATALLAANAAIGAALAAVLKDSASYLLSHGFFLAFVGLSLLGLLISVYHCLICIAPRLFPQRNPLPNLLDIVGQPHYVAAADQKTSVLYFEHIASQPTPNAYLERALPVFTDSQRLMEDVSEQIWANSTVARAKTYHVGRAVQYFIWALLVAILVVVIFLLVQRG